MASPETKEELKTRVLEMLGEPVIKINIADAQLTNAVDDAVEYWSEFHVDGQDRSYLKVTVSDDDVTNGYLTLPDSVFAVLDVIDPVRSIGANWMSYEFNMMRDSVYAMTSPSGYDSMPLATMVIAKSYIQELRNNLNPKSEFDYRYYKGRLNIIGFGKRKAGDTLIVEVMGYLYKDSFNVWGDRSLRKLAAAYAKKTWGANLKKFSGVTLPSGLTLNGDAIYSDALQEIEQAEEYILSQTEPLGIIIG
jgi:hypothetical protein